MSEVEQESFGQKNVKKETKQGRGVLNEAGKRIRVGIICIDRHTKKILLIQKKEKDGYKLPGGGFELRNGHLFNSVVREFMEEAGAVCFVVEQLGEHPDEKNSSTTVFLTAFVGYLNDSATTMWCNFQEAEKQLQFSKPEQLSYLKDFQSYLNSTARETFVDGSGKSDERLPLTLSEKCIVDGVMPDVFKTPLKQLLNVEFNGKFIGCGNLLKTEDVSIAPKLDWMVETASLHCLILVGPDQPSRINPLLRESLKWLVLNIPGKDVSAGEAIFDYKGDMGESGGCAGSVKRRFVFLVYEQLGHMHYSKTNALFDGRINSCNLDLQTGDMSMNNWKAEVFVDKNMMIGPVAVNYFMIDE